MERRTRVGVIAAIIAGVVLGSGLKRVGIGLTVGLLAALIVVLSVVGRRSKHK